jgi:hypothetical protein
MRTASLVTGPRTGPSADAQVLIEQARGHARRRRLKIALSLITIAAVAGGGLAGLSALSGGGPAARSGPGRLVLPNARTGEVTGYIDPCEAIGVGLPYAAGTVTALRGTQTWRPDGDGTYRLQLPAAVAASEHVGQNQMFSFRLAPGRYVIVGRYGTGDGMTFLDVSVVVGQVLRQNLPDICK